MLAIMIAVDAVAVGVGVASALLAISARKMPVLGWLALSPFGVALLAGGRSAAIAGAVTGSLLHGSVTLSQPPRLRPLGFVFGGVGWAVAAGGGGMLLEAFRHTGAPSEALGLVGVLPAVPWLATLPMRLAGAPRWVHAALACSQERWPVVIRTGWVGGDATVGALLSLSACVPLLLSPALLWAPGLAALVVAFIFGALGASARSLARTRRAITHQRLVRVAAVVANGTQPEERPLDGLWPMESPAYRDVDATVLRYEPLVASAAAKGAELVVLPEVALLTEGEGVERWLAAVGRWAREHDVTMVAPYYDAGAPANTLTVVEPSGRRWSYDKQHPAPGLEPPPRVRQAPGPLLVERGGVLSTVICVDLDYADLIATLRAAGGVLVVPANDWPGFDRLHDQSAVWAAVLSETTVLRATGHGICSVRDGAGRVLARASSLDGPTVLVVDAPIRDAPIRESR